MSPSVKSILRWTLMTDQEGGQWIWAESRRNSGASVSRWLKEERGGGRSYNEEVMDGSGVVSDQQQPQEIFNAEKDNLALTIQGINDSGFAVIPNANISLKKLSTFIACFRCVNNFRSKTDKNPNRT